MAQVKDKSSHIPKGEFGDHIALHMPSRPTRSGIEKSRYGLEMGSTYMNKVGGYKKKKHNPGSHKKMY